MFVLSLKRWLMWAQRRGHRGTGTAFDEGGGNGTWITARRETPTPPQIPLPNPEGGSRSRGGSGVSLRTMDFMVITNSDGSYDNYSGEATYSIEGSVLTARDEQRHIVYGPAGWVRVEVGSGPEPFATYA